MRKPLIIAIISVFCLTFLGTACHNTSGNSVVEDSGGSEENASPNDSENSGNNEDCPECDNRCSPNDLLEITETEMLARNFIIEKAMSPKNGIWSNLHDEGDSDPSAGIDHDIISESMGLWIYYAALARDREFFDTAATFIKEHLQTPNGLLYWRLFDDLSVDDSSNASIDDLRVIKGLMIGADCWADDQARELAISIADGMKGCNIVEGKLSQAGSWDNNNCYVDEDVIFSYADIGAMKLLVHEDPTWQEVIDSTIAIMISDNASFASGLHQFGYDTDTESYINYPNGSSTVNMINEVWTAIALAEAGKIAPAQVTLDFLISKYNSNGKINGRYSSAGTVLEGASQDIAVYALTARLALLLNEKAFAKNMFSVIADLQVTNPTFETFGAFRWSESSPDEGRVHIFSQLTALVSLALERRQNLQ
jgi:endo-1,4-beta-D-glucanase Y